MNISYLIVTLALSNIQYDAIVQPASFTNNSVVLRDTGRVLLTANGNPWAMPAPDAEYPRSTRRQPAPVNRPHYISPEELQSLERLPEEESSYGFGRAPLNTDKAPGRGKSLYPLYGGTGYYGRGYNPLGGLYGNPLYPGIDPYGGVPYWGSPYERYLPFMY